MSDIFIGDVTPPQGEDIPVVGSASIVDLIKSDLAELEEAKDVIIPIKGYEKSGLAIQYRLPRSGKELDDIAQKIFRETKDQYFRGVLITIDTMIHLCVGLYVNNPDDGYPVQLDIDGVPVGLNANLAKLLNWEDPGSSRAVVRRLFGDNEIAIGMHSAKLQRWLQNTKADLQTELWDGLLGEM